MKKPKKRYAHSHPAINPTGRCEFNGMFREPCVKKRCAPSKGHGGARPSKNLKG